ncbi:hypothetical protein SAMN02910417_00220 [Eubacterium oxidoreducens]|uniref:Uncharacterized protein n=2 Tax=Eubacterium oxidoreducens TaxID=1732 RepID=A0A1G6A3F4_EUBOX|nr:hypothetical protein SAMN02910417_00220 [Eubacterium oxidoreducens]
MAQATRLMSQSAAERAHNAQVVREAGNRWICLLMGLPYREEMQVYDTMKAIYYQAYREARKEYTGAVKQTTGNFDAKA